MSKVANALPIRILLALVLVLQASNASRARDESPGDFGVVFGDSLAEGAPGLHSRLHADRRGTVRLDLRSKPGQLSGELGRELSDRGPLDGLNRWINHGVGGQTSDQLLRRLERDVLAGPSTGKETPRTPGATLESIPKTVLISSGTNDLARARLKTFDQALKKLKANTLAMVQKFESAGVSPIFLTLPVHGKRFADETQESSDKRSDTIRAFNRWLKSDVAERSGVRVFDFAEFCERRKSQDQDRYFVDPVHPSEEGYTTLSLEIALKFSKKKNAVAYPNDSGVDAGASAPSAR